MIWEIIKKEIRELIKTRRLLIIGALFFAVITALAVVSAYYLDQGPNEMLSSTLYSITPFFISLLAIMLSYDTISGERSKGSLRLVLSKPVARLTIFGGKFLAILAIVGLMVLVINSWGYWLNAAVYGEFPSGQDVLSAYLFFLSTLLPIACWVAFSMLFSVLLKSPTTTLVTVLILWVLVLPVISEIPFLIYLFGTHEPVIEPSLYPAWVKATYALNPDNSFLALKEALVPSGLMGLSFNVLSAVESIIAMAVFSLLFWGLGANCFDRLSLE